MLYMYACICIYIYRFTHAHTRIHIYIYTYTYIGVSLILQTPSFRYRWPLYHPARATRRCVWAVQLSLWPPRPAVPQASVFGPKDFLSRLALILLVNFDLFLCTAEGIHWCFHKPCIADACPSETPPTSS